MILVIDNYDSFTFNIYDYLCQTNQDVKVIKNDELSLNEIKKLTFDKIILSPGPGNPNHCGISLEVLDAFKKSHKILGICLGHQIIAHYFGYQIIKAPRPMHGKIDMINHNAQGIFKDIKNPLSVVRYHSLIVESNSSNQLEVTAVNKENIIMAQRHPTFDIESVQFHPEAIKTECGLKIIKNFVFS